VEGLAFAQRHCRGHFVVVDHSVNHWTEMVKARAMEMEMVLNGPHPRGQGVLVGSSSFCGSASSSVSSFCSLSVVVGDLVVCPPFPMADRR